ncbi:hypothetical protein [Nostoc sp. LEGE 06077]|uniref:hypothetical protein n=1 Tax=Nostoc sp. LEGE 06077 TaxID=915325 RepID=UPI001D148DE3|nr:hypothetical protein [Nostoc sp. LEGE 06077]
MYYQSNKKEYLYIPEWRNVYRKEKYTKTSLDGKTEIIEIEERNPSGLLEFCGAIIAITLSILTATLVLQGLNHADSFRRMDERIYQPKKHLSENTWAEN